MYQPPVTPRDSVARLQHKLSDENSVPTRSKSAGSYVLVSLHLCGDDLELGTGDAGSGDSGFRAGGRVIFVAALVFQSLLYNPLNFAWSRQSATSMDRMATLIRKHDRGGGLLVYDGPPYLYALAGKAPPSPLTFPHRLNHMIEKDVSHLNTRAELERIIAKGPGVVVISLRPLNQPANVDSYRRIRRYVQSHCQIVGIEIASELRVKSPMVIFGDCDPPSAVQR